MTLLAPAEFPLNLEEALLSLKDSLGANYGAETDPATLTRALGYDAVVSGSVVHPRPWATAARLIRENTEYEVNKGLQAQIDRKLAGLERMQGQMDALAGISHLVPQADDAQGWVPHGGPVRTEGVF